MSKIILFSDLHCHTYTEFSGPPKHPENINSRFENCLMVLDTIRQFAIKNGIQTVIHAGDLFHKRDVMRTAMYNLVFDRVRKFAEADLELVLLVGNHDQTTLDGRVHSLEPMKGLKRVYVIDQPDVRYFDDSLSVQLVPYMESPKDFKAAMKFDGLRRNCNILVAHGGVQGAVTGPMEYQPKEQLSVDELPTDYDFKFFGHYHKRQRLGERCWYIGSPLQQNRGERNDLNKGFLVYDTSTCKFTTKRIMAPEFVTVNADKLDTLKVTGNYIDVAANVEDREKLAERLKDAAAWSIVPVAKPVERREARVNVSPGMDLLDMSDRYIGKYAPEDLDDDYLHQLTRQFLEVP